MMLAPLTYYVRWNNSNKSLPTKPFCIAAKSCLQLLLRFAPNINLSHSRHLQFPALAIYCGNVSHRTPMTANGCIRYLTMQNDSMLDMICLKVAYHTTVSKKHVSRRVRTSEVSKIVPVWKNGRSGKRILVLFACELFDNRKQQPLPPLLQQCSTESKIVLTGIEVSQNRPHCLYASVH